MKIAIDIQTTLGQPTGFGFYVSNLIETLRKNKSEHEFVLIRPETQKDFSTPQRFWWDQVTLPRRARSEGADLLHQPCFSAPFIFRGPVVVTIHDIISILFPENIPFASRMFYSYWMPFSYRKATRIITISQSTKRDIEKVLKIPGEKISVIPLAVDEKFKEKVSEAKIKEVRDKYSLPEHYLLHIGTLEPRKNLEFLIEVFHEVIKQKENSNLYLVISGKKGWYYEGLFKRVKELKLGNRVIFTGDLAEEDKAAVYRGARIFTFPSIYEGFGLPPLEAMASGVPVISSNTSSMPEVIGEAGVLISPKDKNAWVKAITQVNSNDTLRHEMILKNVEQVEKFSWAKTAQRTIDVYDLALKEYNGRKTT